jgi:hypothetical protein
MGQAALALATAYGFRVHPAVGKVPLLEGWTQRASVDPAAIAEFWTEHPDANIGVHTVGLLVLDVDPEKGGFQSLQALEQKHGPLPRTPKTITGGAGEHNWFRRPAGIAILNSTSALAPGLDIKTDGGQVIVPPSIHPDTGRTYEWSAEHHPADLPIAEAPAWLVELAVEQAKRDAPYRLPNKILKGDRNNQLYRYGRSERKRGVDQTTHEARLREANDQRCQPPLSERQIQKIIEHTWTQPDRADFDRHVDGNDEEAESLEEKPPRKSQATQLIELATAHAEFFHTPDREPFASILCDTHREIWPVKTKFFRQWLAGLHYQETKGAIGSQAMQDALAVLQSMAIFKNQNRDVSLRLAEHRDAIYLDLANDQWQAVEITKDGWVIVDAPPVAFRRPNSMLPLPAPVRGGSLAPLREVLNICDDNQWTLFLSWLVGALRPCGPYPVLTLDGEQGTGKSTVAKTSKMLIDPAKANNRGAPRTVRDLMIAASNGWLLSFDNLSHISQDLSDGLCRLSTGGGLSTRELFSDADEIIFEATRPIVVNAIGDVIVRPDLVDRAVIVTPPLIPKQNRREEKKLMAQLAAMRPQVLGALLDAVVCGLRHVESITLPSLPRMADFAVWITACAPALGWEPEAFIDAYEANRIEAVEIGLDASPIVAPLRELLDKYEHTAWEGPASSLLKQLTEIVGESASRAREWPTQPNALSNMLKRLSPALRETGIEVGFDKRKRGRTIYLTRLTEKGPSPSSPSSPLAMGSGAGDDPVTMVDDGGTMQGGERTSHKHKGSDDGDDGDDDLQTFSNDEDPLIIYQEDPEDRP